MTFSHSAHKIKPMTNRLENTDHFIAYVLFCATILAVLKLSYFRVITNEQQKSYINENLQSLR